MNRPEPPDARPDEIKGGTTFREANAWFGAILAIIGVMMLINSLMLQFFRGAIPGPGFMPTVLSVLLIIASVWLVAERFLPSDSPDTRFELPTRPELFRPLTLWATTIAYALLMAPLGFLVSTFLFLMVIGFVVERRHGLGEVILALALPFATWVLFGKLLSVPLPRGILPF